MEGKLSTVMYRNYMELKDKHEKQYENLERNLDFTIHNISEEVAAIKKGK